MADPRDIQQQAEKIREIIERMRSDGPRYKSHDLGYVDSVGINTVEDWADELGTILAALPAWELQRRIAQARVALDGNLPQARDPQPQDEAHAKVLEEIADEWPALKAACFAGARALRQRP